MPVYRAVVVFGKNARFIKIGKDVKVFCCLGADPFLEGLRTYWRDLDLAPGRVWSTSPSATTSITPSAASNASSDSPAVGYLGRALTRVPRVEDAR